jgi:hypothetical protein
MTGEVNGKVTVKPAGDASADPAASANPPAGGAFDASDSGDASSAVEVVVSAGRPPRAPRPVHPSRSPPCAFKEARDGHAAGWHRSLTLHGM